jgi:hypothetical protein
VLDRRLLFILLHLRRSDDVDREEGKIAAERIELALGLGEHPEQLLVIELLAGLQLFELRIERRGNLRLRRHLHLVPPPLGALAQRTPVHGVVDARADRAGQAGGKQKRDQQHPIGAILAGKLGGHVFGDFGAGRAADIGPAVIHEIHRRAPAAHIGEVEQHRPKHEQHHDGDDREPDGVKPDTSTVCSHERGGKLQVSRMFEPSLVKSP